MKFKQHQPDPTISPALRAAALEAARLVALANAMDDVIDLTRLRADSPTVEALMQLRDSLRADAKTHITKETK